MRDKQDIVAQTLLKSIVDYVNSNEFVPKDFIESKALISILYGSSANVKTRQTNDNENTKGYNLD